MKRTLFLLAVPSISVCGLISVSAQAGELPGLSAAAASETSPDWCEWLSGKPGTMYKGAHPVVQQLVIGGRFHWQAAYLWGEDTNGYEFSDDYTEVRRCRLEVYSKFLNYFALKATVDLVDDARNRTARWPGNDSLGWGYEQFDEATLAFDLKKAFGIEGVESLTMSYGRHKFKLSHEMWSSSNELLTVERSAISNKVAGGFRPTGVLVEAAGGPWKGGLGLFSTDASAPTGPSIDWIGGWNDGVAYYGSLGYTVKGDLELVFDFIYNDANLARGEDVLWGYEWAASLSAYHDAGKWGVMVNGIFGDNGGARVGNNNASRQGDFWAVVLMPHYWLVEERLQAVVRYQYAGSDGDQGTRVNVRYVRADHGQLVNASINGGRGNEHHAIYGGLNYYFCGHRLKVQSGLEYEWLNTPGAGSKGDLSALTLWFGFRTSF